MIGDVPYAKPDPDIYIATAGHFGLETHQALVIEDSTQIFPHIYVCIYIYIYIYIKCIIQLKLMIGSIIC